MKETKNKKAGFIVRQGFTLLELLLVMAIMGILAGIVFVSIGSQRQKAKMNAVLQTAKGAQAIAQECYFRVRKINQPSTTSEICDHSSTKWFSITVPGCVYASLNATQLTQYYEINCPSFNKKVQCNIRPSGECKILDYP